MNCHGCACDRCVYNAELESWYFTPGEVQDVDDICYCCDECKHYDGDYAKKSLWRPECEKRKLPCKYIEMQRRTAERTERVAATRRKNFTIIKGGRS